MNDNALEWNEPKLLARAFERCPAVCEPHIFPSFTFKLIEFRLGLGWAAVSSMMVYSQFCLGHGMARRETREITNLYRAAHGDCFVWGVYNDYVFGFSCNCFLRCRHSESPVEPEFSDSFDRTRTGLYHLSKWRLLVHTYPC
jgi:hypothetical protein